SACLHQDVSILFHKKERLFRLKSAFVAMHVVQQITDPYSQNRYLERPTARPGKCVLCAPLRATKERKRFVGIKGAVRLFLPDNVVMSGHHRRWGNLLGVNQL